jgi:hypothetical protein
LLAVLLATAFFGGCEPELGSRCSPDPDVEKRVQQKAGSNDLVRDVNFESCTQLLCLSYDGSRPYCTRQCESDLDCDAEGFLCGSVTEFSQLACSNYDEENQTCPRNDDGTIEQPIKYCYAPKTVIDARDGN